MVNIKGFNEVAEQILRERGISRDSLYRAIESALISACRKKFRSIDNLRAEIDDKGTIRILAKKKIVKTPADEELEISLKGARLINPKLKLEEEVEVEVTPSDFGRLAAQTAKQVIIQRIREAEKETVYDEFARKQGEVVTAVVQRKEYGGYLVNLGRVETFLSNDEMIPREAFRPKDHVKVYIVETRKASRGPQVVISRTHPDFVRRLFELEVPEIAEGVIEIKGVSRDPGRRSKMAVRSLDKNVGAVGTCIGHMGARIQNVTKELGNERIDVIEWNEDPEAFITHAISPAKPSFINIDEETGTAIVVVAEDQQALAIGKEGQNVRLASKLTGWKLDIISEKAAEEHGIKKGKKKKKRAVTDLSPEARKAKGEDTETRKEKKEEKIEEKIKVSAVAKELGIKSKELIEKLKVEGVEVKAAASMIDEETRKMITAKLAAQTAPEKDKNNKDE